MRRALVLLTVALLALAGCGDEQRLVVLTASSLTDVTEALAEAAGLDIAVSAAGSQALFAQIVQGAPADVLLLADPDFAEGLVERGEAQPPVTVARTDLAIAVRSDRVDVVLGPADLARPELRVVLADSAVPLGIYTRAALRQLEEEGQVPVGTRRAVLDGADSLEDAARSVLTKLTTGEADAAIVFAADEHLAPSLTFVPWPVPIDVRYTAQVLGQAPHPELAERFVRFLDSDDAAAVWERFGFVPTP